MKLPRNIEQIPYTSYIVKNIPERFLWFNNDNEKVKCVVVLEFVLYKTH